MVVRALIILFALAASGCTQNESPSRASDASQLTLGGIGIGTNLEELLDIHPGGECYNDPLSEVEEDKACGYDRFSFGSFEVPVTFNTSKNVVEGAYNNDLHPDSVALLETHFRNRYGDPDTIEPGTLIWKRANSAIQLSQGGFSFFKLQVQSPISPPVAERGSSAGACTAAPIVIKGICVGMPLQTAVTRLNDALEIELVVHQGYSAEPPPLDAPEVMLVAPYPDLVVGGMGVEVVGRHGTLHTMVLKTAAIELLFGAADLAPDEFAQEFVNSYRIPSMEGKSQRLNIHGRMATVHTWSYRYSQAGVLVEILAVDGMSAKTIAIKSVTPASRRAFD